MWCFQVSRASKAIGRAHPIGGLCLAAQGGGRHDGDILEYSQVNVTCDRTPPHRLSRSRCEASTPRASRRSCARLGCSLLVATDQAGKLIVARNDGGVLNTHFRTFPKPMGLAANRRGFALGCAREVRTYVNMPAVARKLDPPREARRLLPIRVTSTSPGISISTRWPGTQAANSGASTPASRACARGSAQQLRAALAPALRLGSCPEDRCHLNGLGRSTDSPATSPPSARRRPPGMASQEGQRRDADRPRRAGNGLPGTVHAPLAALVCRRLWVLESGNGSGDGRSRRRDAATLAELPGFTRGFYFCGPLAFVGLSQVRESACSVASQSPNGSRSGPAGCGSWRARTGQTVAFVRFEATMQEIFAVEVLPGMCYPEILEPADDLIASSYMLPG